jgi:hypothetical protein
MAFPVPLGHRFLSQDDFGNIYVRVFAISTVRAIVDADTKGPLDRLSTTGATRTPKLEQRFPLLISFIIKKRTQP